MSALQGIEVSRSHSAIGSFGGAVSGASNASPVVITTSAAHGLGTGDQVQITAVTGNTAANGTWFINVLTSTTFQLYSDVNLSVASTGNGAYVSGGGISIAFPISGLSGNWTLQLNINSLTAAKNATVCVQDSADGFVSDIVTHAAFNAQGGSTGGSYMPPNGFVIDQVSAPDIRFGVANARLRVFVSQLDAGATVNCSLFLLQ